MRSRFRAALCLRDEARLFRALERIDRSVILFARRLNEECDGLADAIAESYENRTLIERLSPLLLNNRTQLAYDLRRIRESGRDRLAMAPET